MYLALREFKFAKGRFSLIVAVVALMTLLVGFLTGIAGGLASQNISALLRTGADQVVFAAATEERKMSYAESTISAATAAEWSDISGVRATPLSIVNGAAEANGTKKTVALFAGVDPDGAAVPSRSDIVLGAETAAALGVAVGDSVTLAGAELRVAEVTTDEFYSHLPVAWASLETAEQFYQSTRQEAPYATVLLLHQEAAAAAGATGADTAAADTAAATTETASADNADTAAEIAAVAAATETQAEPMLLSLLTLDAFKAQLGSLSMMIGMLIAIAALVIGVFFLVWSMQRQRDIAVLKALGAKTSWLVRDSVGQALLVLVLGVLLGAAATFALGAVVSSSNIPFVSGVLPVLIPGVLMIIAGLLGALVSLRQIVKADPNTALQASGG